MVDHYQYHKIKDGVDDWNNWRKINPEKEIDLTGADLAGVDLSGIDLSYAILNEVDLTGATLWRANLSMSDLQNANLVDGNFGGSLFRFSNLSYANCQNVGFHECDLFAINLSKSNLRGANLVSANMYNADLSGADMTDSKLMFASLVMARMQQTKLDGSSVYGASVWDVTTDAETSQNDLVVEFMSNKISVDNIKIAQFLYLLLENEEFRTFIESITSKVILILGRFTKERKSILDAMKNELRDLGFVPVLFDFEKPSSRDLTETISVLAHMSQFVIADITDAKSIPQELQKIVPNLPSLPIRPIILKGQFEYGMFKDLAGYYSFLPPFRYESLDHLIKNINSEVIDPALLRANDIASRRRDFDFQLSKKN